MSSRRRVKLRQPEAVLLPNIHNYLLLMAGEVLKLNGRGRLLRLAIKCGSTVVSRTVSQSDWSCRIIVPIAYLAIGHAHYLHRDMDVAIDYLQLARGHFHTLPDSPLKQFYLGRCICLLIESHAWLGRLDRDADVSSDGVGLLRGLMDLLIDQTPGQRRFKNMADNALLKLAHPPTVWYERCLYDIVEITTANLHINRSSNPDPHHAKLVALLLGMPSQDALVCYRIEREFALSLTFHSKMDEALALWKRLLHWKFKSRDDDEEEEDAIRFRIVTCLVTLGRVRDAKAELLEMDLARSLIHFSHGPGLLYLARRTYYQLGEFETLLDLCRGYQDLCDAKFNPNDIVPLMNRYYSARILKRLGRYEEAVQRYRAFVSIVEKTTELMSGDLLAIEIDSTKTLEGLLGEGRRGLGHALRLRNCVDECVFQYRKALQLARTESLSDFKVIRAILKSLAYLYESTGDRKNAIISYDLLHRQYLRKRASDPMAAIKYSWYRGKMFMLMREYGHAILLFQRASITCAAKRMERAKTKWPTPTELELARKTIEKEDVDEEDVTPIPKDNAAQGQGQAQGRVQGLGETSAEVTRQSSEEEHSSRFVDHSYEPPVPSHEPTEEDLDVEDRSPFGAHESTPKITIRGNDRWWARTIETSMGFAERHVSIEDPVPLDHYDSDPEETAPEAEEPTLAGEPLAVEPIGKRRDELMEPRFEELPATYEEFQAAKMNEKRYPWRNGKPFNDNGS